MEKIPSEAGPVMEKTYQDNSHEHGLGLAHAQSLKLSWHRSLVVCQL